MSAVSARIRSTSVRASATRPKRHQQIGAAVLRAGQAKHVAQLPLHRAGAIERCQSRLKVAAAALHLRHGVQHAGHPIAVAHRLHLRQHLIEHLERRFEVAELEPQRTDVVQAAVGKLVKARLAGRRDRPAQRRECFRLSPEPGHDAQCGQGPGTHLGGLSGNHRAQLSGQRGGPLAGPDRVVILREHQVRATLARCQLRKQQGVGRRQVSRRPAAELQRLGDLATLQLALGEAPGDLGAQRCGSAQHQGFPVGGFRLASAHGVHQQVATQQVQLARRARSPTGPGEERPSQVRGGKCLAAAEQRSALARQYLGRLRKVAGLTEVPGCLQHISSSLLEPIGRQPVKPTAARHVPDQPGVDLVAHQRMQQRGRRVIDELVALQLGQGREQVAWALGRLVQLHQGLVVEVDRLAEHRQQCEQGRGRLTELAQGGVEQVVGDLGLGLEMLDQAGRFGRSAQLSQRESQQHRAPGRPSDQTLDQLGGKGLVELGDQRTSLAGLQTCETKHAHPGKRQLLPAGEEQAHRGGLDEVADHRHDHLVVAYQVGIVHADQWRLRREGLAQ